MCGRSCFEGSGPRTADRLRAIRLYYRAQTGRPLRVAWELEELRVPYETVKLTAEECQGAEHLSRQPLGRVPAVEFDDGEVLFDSTAIVLAIADRHPDRGLIGPVGSPLRDEVYAWALLGMTELEPAAVNARFVPNAPDEYKAGQHERAGAATAAIGKRLADNQFLLGEKLTAADIVVGGVLALDPLLGVLETAPDNVVAYAKRLRDRPQLVKAMQRVEAVGTA